MGIGDWAQSPIPIILKIFFYYKFIKYNKINYFKK